MVLSEVWGVTLCHAFTYKVNEGESKSKVNCAVEALQSVQCDCSYVLGIVAMSGRFS